MLFLLVRIRYAESLRRSHIFDGETATSDTAAFQLCDLHDPMLKEMIENEDDLREVCDVSNFDIMCLAVLSLGVHIGTYGMVLNASV